AVAEQFPVQQAVVREQQKIAADLVRAIDPEEEVLEEHREPPMSPASAVVRRACPAACQASDQYIAVSGRRREMLLPKAAAGALSQSPRPKGCGGATMANSHDSSLQRIRSAGKGGPGLACASPPAHALAAHRRGRVDPWRLLLPGQP